MEWKIGCSGFYYPEWKKFFYPQNIPTSKWFEYYCTRFNTVELNGTFYRIPKVQQLRRWYDISPPGFKFSVKAFRNITHYKRFLNITSEVKEFCDLAQEGLQDKLGCILFQLPPSFVFCEQNLNNILHVMDPSLNNVVEFRHVSWWCDEAYTAFRNQGVTFCGISHPSLPDDVVATRDLAYYRFHGVPQLYQSSYSVDALQNVVAETEKKGTGSNYIYFNNTMHGNAIANAEEVQAMTNCIVSLSNNLLK